MNNPIFMSSLRFALVDDIKSWGHLYFYPDAKTFILESLASKKQIYLHLHEDSGNDNDFSPQSFKVALCSALDTGKDYLVFLEGAIPQFLSEALDPRHEFRLFVSKFWHESDFMMVMEQHQNGESVDDYPFRTQHVIFEDQWPSPKPNNAKVSCLEKVRIKPSPAYGNHLFQLYDEEGYVPHPEHKHIAKHANQNYKENQVYNLCVQQNGILQLA